MDRRLQEMLDHYESTRTLADYMVAIAAMSPT